MKKVEPVLGGIAGAALFATMLLTFVDVLGRKLFDASLPGAVELTEVMLLLLIFLALPITTLRGEHVVFDLLDKWIGARGRIAQHRIAHAICMVILGGAAWLVFDRAGRSAEMNDMTAVLHVPLAPLHYVAALFLLFDALVHVYLFIRPAEEPEEPDPTHIAGA